MAIDDTTQHNNDHAAALELWEVMGEVEGLRPKNISLDYDCWKYQFPGDQRKVKLEAADALFILTGHAERWLRERGRGWEIYKRKGVVIYSLTTHGIKRHHSLPAAIRAEIGRGK